jgi:hypothetical protein
MFSEFALGKLQKTRSKLLILGQNWKIGVGGEENFPNSAQLSPNWENSLLPHDSFPSNISILPLVKKFETLFLNFFSKFALGKLRKTHSELLIQGQNWEGGGEENFPCRCLTFF